MIQQRTPTPAWTRRTQKGDVLRSGSGMLRVVRSVRHSPITGYGIRTTVIFTIQACSWTGRCYTVYTGNDLKQMGYRPTGKRVALRTKLDREIELEFAERYQKPKLHCCDVRGVA